MRTQIQTRPGTTTRRFDVIAILNWLAAADARIRAKQKLKNMPAEPLDDMGMTRADAERAFR